MQRLVSILTACALALVLGACASGGGPSPIEDVEGQSYYTQLNMWFHDGEHETTNYRVTERLPVNSKVTIKDTTSETITLETSEGKEYVIINIPEYTKKDIEGIFDRYFASTKVDLGRFSKRERRAIENGNLTKGMSKKAVLVARGYPPAHKTPSTDSDRWRFWKTPHDTRLVFFENGRIARFKD